MTEKSIENKQACLEAAIRAVCGDRHLNYGKPEDNFKRIAALWEAYTTIRHSDVPGFKFTPTDVALLMILMKVARLAYSPGHNDSWIDIAGYAACGYDIENR
jgi:hypothetical protein